MAQSPGAMPFTGTVSDLGLGAGGQLSAQAKETAEQKRKRLLGLTQGSNLSPAVQSLFGGASSAGAY